LCQKSLFQTGATAFERRNVTSRSHSTIFPRNGRRHEVSTFFFSFLVCLFLNFAKRLVQRMGHLSGNNGHLCTFRTKSLVLCKCWRFQRFSHSTRR
jgi:hypothetical protein